MSHSFHSSCHAQINCKWSVGQFTFLLCTSVAVNPHPSPYLIFAYLSCLHVSDHHTNLSVRQTSAWKASFVFWLLLLGVFFGGVFLNDFLNHCQSALELHGMNFLDILLQEFLTERIIVSVNYGELFKFWRSKVDGDHCTTIWLLVWCSFHEVLC